MKTFKVHIVRQMTVEDVVFIEADTTEKAEDMAKERLENGDYKYILDEAEDSALQGGYGCEEFVDIGDTFEVDPTTFNEINII